MNRHFVAEPEATGKRLDRYLAERLPEVSRSVIAKLIVDGCAIVDGAPANKGLKLKAGNIVEFALPEPVKSELLPEAMPLDILFEDEDIAIIAKPAGVCVHPAPGHSTRTIVNGLLYRYPRIACVGSMKRPGIVHRLDLDTSGAMAIALSPRAYTGLSTLIRKRLFKREYLAVVTGEPAKSEATINMPLARDPLQRRRFAVPRSGRKGKSAVTHYRVAERFGRASLLSVKLETGRTHQIRVHMKMIGHPVCGDKVYGGDRPDWPIARQALHSHRLSFLHPIGGREIAVIAPVPDDFRVLLDFLRTA